MNEQLNQRDEEISIQNNLDFLRNSWKTIAIATGIGLVAAFAYVIIAPKQYEAVAQIRMAQIGLTNPANPFGMPVEEPVSLIARMKMPTNYEPWVIEACDYQNKPDPATALVKSLKFSAPKGLANTVEIKVLAYSQELAKDCTKAVVRLISNLQAQFAKPFIEEAKLKLTQDNERIEAARRLIAKADQSGDAMSGAYLSARDEISYYLIDREKMIDLINSAENRGTKLVSPIYVPETEVSPKKAISILLGLFTGFFLGLLTTLLKRVWQKMFVEANVGVR